jgi:histidyl-tRNA synthetase
MSGPEIEAELIFICARIWKALGLQDIELQINTLGTSVERAAYRQHLVEYLSAHMELLDEDSLRRLDTNPLRILDSKNPAMQELIESAPKLIEHLGEVSTAHFARLQQLLDTAGVDYTVNPRLVRGLDYYSHTVFEWVTYKLGAQGTVCAGGRYDSLVEQLGGKPTFASGFAMGQERLVALLEDQGVQTDDDRPHVFFINAGEQAQVKAVEMAEQLRSDISGLRLILNCGGGSLKAQMKRADKSGAAIAVILGDRELEQSEVSLKYLRLDLPQQSVPMAGLTDFIKETIDKGII